MLNKSELSKLRLLKLREMAQDMGISEAESLKKAELIGAILSFATNTEETPKGKRVLNTEEQPKDKSSLNTEESPKGGKTKRTQKARGTSKTQARVQEQIGAVTETENEAEAEEEGNDATYADPIHRSNIKEGILEVLADGYGFLRSGNYESGEDDVFVPQSQIRRFNLRTGDYIVGNTRLQPDYGRHEALIYVKTVNGEGVNAALRRRSFDELTPIYPNERLRLETDGGDFAMRLIDLVAPIGKGQRGIIVAPPKAGKTTLLKNIAKSISQNNPETKLIVLLIDERPEEVTDMQRSISGDVVYSTFDEEPEHHAKVAEMVLSRAKRLVEHGRDVVILLDSITRLARAYNLTITATGRTLSGGLDPGALFKPKRFFGAARNIEGGGSLTILATALTETGSRADDVIYEEFKGTGNMEVHLDRKMQEKRIFPAIDIAKSGTRREELLLSPAETEAIWTVRKAFSNRSPQEVTENIISHIIKTKNNKVFIENAAKFL